MTAFNIVRFRVKPGHQQHFIAAHRAARPDFKGFRGGALVRTGEQTFCIIGEWANFKKLAEARPQMIGMLDTLPRRPRGSRRRPRPHRSGVRRGGGQAAGEQAGEERRQGKEDQTQEAALESSAHKLKLASNR